MNIWLVGGGTAGHVLPLTALASELKAQGVATRLIIDRSATANSSIGGYVGLVNRLWTGKFRRYHGRSWLNRLSDVDTLLLNLKDMFLIGLGTAQCIGLMLLKRPDVIFINGGAIGVPVGLTARMLRVRYLIHESDTKPGLANRLIGGGARRILLGLTPIGELEDRKTYFTGIPLRESYIKWRGHDASEIKNELGLDPKRPLVLVTGGSQGSGVVNQAIMHIAPELTEFANVIHICGPKHIKSVTEASQLFPKHYRALGFAQEEMGQYLASATVVVARAGATTLAELAYFAKPAILIPNPLLVGGHQLSNASLFAQAEAAEVLAEAQLTEDPGSLLALLKALLDSTKRRRQLSENIALFAKPNATADIVGHILAVRRGE